MIAMVFYHYKSEKRVEQSMITSSGLTNNGRVQRTITIITKVSIALRLLSFSNYDPYYT